MRSNLLIATTTNSSKQPDSAFSPDKPKQPS